MLHEYLKRHQINYMDNTQKTVSSNEILCMSTRGSALGFVKQKSEKLGFLKEKEEREQPCLAKHCNEDRPNLNFKKSIFNTETQCQSL